MLCSAKSNSEHAAALGQSKKVLWTFMQAPEKYGEAKCSGRPPKSSAAGRRGSYFEAHKKHKSARQLC